MGMPLVITDQERTRAAELVAYAAANPELYVTILRRLGKPDNRGPGDDPRHVMMIPMGFQCCYSHEQQPKLGMCRHLSVSLKAAGRVPSPPAMSEIMRLFGFRLSTDSNKPWGMAHIWIEDLPEGRSALNALQRIEDTIIAPPQ